MKKCILSLVAITFVILLSNCKEPNTAIEYGSISGTIYEGLTLKKINLAEISTTPATSSVVSSSIGEYKIDFITPGNYELLINCSGYKSKNVKIQIIANKTTTANVILEKGNEQNKDVEYGSISGYVYDGQNSQPINHAEISTSPATSSVVSNLTGAYKIDFITPGIYELQISRTGFKSKKVKIQIISNKTTIADVILDK